jgi:hypothetical protein
MFQTSFFTGAVPIRFCSISSRLFMFAVPFFFISEPGAEEKVRFRLLNRIYAYISNTFSDI